MWFETKQFSLVYNVLNFFTYLPDHILIIQGVIAFWSLVGVSVNILKQVVFWNDHRGVFFFMHFQRSRTDHISRFLCCCKFFFSWIPVMYFSCRGKCFMKRHRGEVHALSEWNGKRIRWRWFYKILLKPFLKSLKPRFNKN